MGRFWNRAALLGLSIGAVAAAALIAVFVGHRAGATPVRAADPIVSVHRNQLLLDGQPWLPRGVQIVGLVAPDNLLKGQYKLAHEHFGQAELQAAIAKHADMVRIQVSQFGLDPKSPDFSSAYVSEVWRGVELARGLGLEVIVSVQAEPPGGNPNRCDLPTAGTRRVWDVLAPMFASDHGVVFELYNEPKVTPSPAGWKLWAQGGPAETTDGGSCTAVGMQRLIDTIRGPHDRAGNVVIVPGAGKEETIAGMPKLTDPSDRSDSQLAYGIHYPSLSGGPRLWNAEFGDASARAPVIVSEWYASEKSKHCSANQPQRVPTLLDYLKRHNIGINGFSFDLPDTIVADWNYDPTTYQNFACHTPGGGGAGQLLFDEYAQQAG